MCRFWAHLQTCLIGSPFLQCIFGWWCNVLSLHSFLVCVESNDSLHIASMIQPTDTNQEDVAQQGWQSPKHRQNTATSRSLHSGTDVHLGPGAHGLSLPKRFDSSSHDDWHARWAHCKMLMEQGHPTKLKPSGGKGVMVGRSPRAGIFKRKIAA